MALSHKKNEARTLRERGMSISEIVRIVGASKSSVMRWCEDIALSKKQIAQISERANDAQRRGRILGATANKEKKLKNILLAEESAKRIVKCLDSREKILIGAALYWAEGAKADSSSGFQFINSDPAMILFIVDCLGAFGVSNEDIYCTIQINEVHRYRILKVLKFWKKLLGLNDAQMRTPSFVKAEVKKHYQNHDVYFGICRLRVRQSTFLKYTFLGLIKALKQGNTMPV